MKQMILWSADWCGPCKTLKAWLHKNAIDIEIRNPEDYPKCAVRGLPTLEIQHNEGESVLIYGSPNIMDILRGD